MQTNYDVIVVGGGLAGCSVARQLADQGHRVLLLEKRHYPSHKLCGEFLSVEVQDMFARLGVLEEVMAAGAHPITETYITTPIGAAFRSLLPGTALGLSRYRLDGLLAKHAEAAGATVCAGWPVQMIAGSFAEGFRVQAQKQVFTARLVLGAYGKRSTLDRKLQRPFLQQKSRYVAFKGHFKGIQLPHTIELHSFRGGYCGMSHVENDVVNACWITTEQTLQAAGGTAEGMIENAFPENAVLASRFASMTCLWEKMLAVSQVTFRPKSVFAGDICMLGDTAGMIAPLCGDGMAMALRSAELVVPFADQMLKGTCQMPAFQEGYAEAWQREFRVRMRLGQWLHEGFVLPGLSNIAVKGLNLWPAAGRWLIRQTRG